MADVLIIMGSDSDLKVMSEAALVLDELQLNYDLTVVSAHRTPDRMYSFAKDALKKGYKLIIAGAGGAAHLPGMVASLTPLPVIGVPIKSSNMSGIDSLYSIVQMPPGIPVATMAINGAKNAGILAGKMIGAHQPDVMKKVISYTAQMEETVLDKAKKLEHQGFKDYLKGM
ncbi:MAG: 5-(carboxyamino)imidazole ribonucleotide mutase [Bacteroidia bacterium]|nr:5-(carboxyamino)imidazole ribonucleotide mutase [Bacteroidia bacterium]NNJ56313.1 5-(carboxyamino)imidazole ribonucleotide mutase [Bacteroidia bacterium]